MRLINRSTRALLGDRDRPANIYERCVAMLVEAEAAQTVIDQLRAEPRGSCG